MKGLLLKDLLLLKALKRSIVIIILIGLCLAFSLEATAVITYLTVLGSMLAVSTLTYDEHEGGFRFLFTLPFRRRTYVYEKYVLAFGISVVFALIGAVVSVIVSLLKGTTFPQGLAESVLGALFAGVIMHTVMIPLRIKFGTEEGHYVSYALFGLLAIAGFLLSQFTGFTFLHTFVVWLDNAPWILIAGILVLFIIALIAISVFFSVKAIEQKEF